MPSVAMKHESDPKSVMLEKIGKYLEGFEIFNNDVLIATYRRPEKTSGGIVLPSSNLDEDLFQSKVGLLVSIGPSCDFPTVKANLYDWVVIRPSDGLAMEILGGKEPIHCRMIQDKYLRAKVPHPDMVW